MMKSDDALKERTIKIAVIGDISLNGRYRSASLSVLKSVFSDIRRLLDQTNSDLLIGNLESPLEGEGCENHVKSPRLKANKRSFNALKALAPDILILGNNHIYDCLEKGYDNTVDWLEENGIRHTGAIKKTTDIFRALRFSIKDQTFSLLSYVDRDTNPSLPADATVEINYLDEEKAVNDIKKESKDSIVMVSLHWGVEFSHYPSPRQKKIAQRFVNAGAQIIIGHHTHTVQGIEQYNNAVIFYSLGNFAFDDVIEADNPVLWTSDQRHGGIGIIDVRDGKIDSASLHVTENKNLSVKIDDSNLWRRRLEKRCKKLYEKENNYNRFWNQYQILESIILPPIRYFFGERKKFSEQVRSIRWFHLKKIFNYIKTYKNNTIMYS